MAYPYQQPYYGGQPWQYQDQLTQLRSAPAPGGGLNWVQGETGAKSWFVTPGSSVLLMDSEEQRFYIKSADPTGMPSLRTFEYTEVGAKPAPVTAPSPDYVTRAEFEQFVRSMMEKKEVPENA